VPLQALVEFPDETLEQIVQAVVERMAGGGQPPEVPPFNDGIVELPREWLPVEERSDVRYRWGDHEDVYEPFTIYEGKNSTGTIRMAIGQCVRTVRDEEKTYFIVILIGPEGGLRAVAEFLETDDYETTGDVIAIIKGKDGTGQQFDSVDELPAVYGPCETPIYRDRVAYLGSYRKLGVVCSELDHAAMLNHGLAQIQIRGLK
jgi:hypothetical protein